MSSYVVTDENGDFRREYPDNSGSGARSGRPWSVDEEDAAEMWAEWMCAQEAEYPEERIAVVTAPDGTVRRFEVTWESVPNFHAREVPDAC